RRIRRGRRLLRWRCGREILMMAKLTVEHFANEVATALGGRLVALLLYGSAARGTHVPDRSDVNTLAICDAVDEAPLGRLERPVRRLPPPRTRWSGRLAPSWDSRRSGSRHSRRTPAARDS